MISDSIVKTAKFKVYHSPVEAEFELENISVGTIRQLLDFFPNQIVRKVR